MQSQHISTQFFHVEDQRFERKISSQTMNSTYIYGISTPLDHFSKGLFHQLQKPRSLSVILMFSFASVTDDSFNILEILISDSCQVNNGGCGPNTICSHDPKTNAVVCSCKPGYTNTGSGSTVVCKGTFVICNE